MRKVLASVRGFVRAVTDCIVSCRSHEEHIKVERLKDIRGSSYLGLLAHF